jgi:hypothetical protein
VPREPQPYHKPAPRLANSQPARLQLARLRPARSRFAAPQRAREARARALRRATEFCASMRTSRARPAAGAAHEELPP